MARCLAAGDGSPHLLASAAAAAAAAAAPASAALGAGAELLAAVAGCPSGAGLMVRWRVRIPVQGEFYRGVGWMVRFARGCLDVGRVLLESKFTACYMTIMVNARKAFVCVPAIKSGFI